MSKTFQQVTAIGDSTAFKLRVRAALTRKIDFVRNESAGSMTVNQIAKRQNLAVDLVHNVDAHTTAMARLIAADGTAADLCTFTGANENTVANCAGIDDDRIINIVDSKFDLLAGVLVSELG